MRAGVRQLRERPRQTDLAQPRHHAETNRDRPRSGQSTKVYSRYQAALGNHCPKLGLSCQGRTGRPRGRREEREGRGKPGSWRTEDLGTVVGKCCCAPGASPPGGSAPPSLPWVPPRVRTTGAAGSYMVTTRHRAVIATFLSWAGPQR